MSVGQQVAKTTSSPTYF